MMDPSAYELSVMLSDARRHTLELVGDLISSQLLGSKLTIVNPPLWEMGHLAWFQERWCLRKTKSGFGQPSVMPDADQLYDSANIPHSIRWDLPLPTFKETLHYMQAVLQQILEKLDKQEPDREFIYFAQLALFHEDMHGEAFTYTRQTLHYPNPFKNPQALITSATELVCNDMYVPGGRFTLGALPGDGFVFDNEKWAHAVTVEPYLISRYPVTYAQYAEFVEADGYLEDKYWTEEGWSWRMRMNAFAPLYWIQHGEKWFVRHFEKMVPLPLRCPVMHVNWHEAQAYCRWAKRRLPTEAEWEMAASLSLRDPSNKNRYPWGNLSFDNHRANLDGLHDWHVDVDAYPRGDSETGCRQLMGNIWEWTASDFQAYPGFVVDPYKEYSLPWFGTHKVLRGGSFATRARLLRNTWRNFFTAERRDIFCGFRTCAPVGKDLS
jgi:iron(II)-dependent oxidoreductase